MFTRKDYMSVPFEQQGEAHRKYYAQFVTPEIKHNVAQFWGVTRLVRAFAKDKSFNTLPLRKWDLLSLPTATHKQLIVAGDWISLGTQICINKEAARQIVEEFTKGVTA